MPFKNIHFILHKPQLSENIGLCARSMKNFNFSNLILIEPKPTFPNDKILATSVGAKEIVKNAKVYKNLEKSLPKFDCLIATSSRFRNKNVEHISLENLCDIDFKKSIAFLFGSEASGLTNNEISYANYTMSIPANSNFKSLNLSHSVSIVAYSLFRILNLKKIKFNKSKKIQNASKKNIINLVNFCISKLNEKNFFHPKEKKAKMMNNLRSIFYRMDLSEKEIRILSSVFAGLVKKKGD